MTLPTDAPVAYARRVGLFSGVMMVIGGIIGSGIFRNPQVVAQRVHTPGLTLGAWVLGGGVALIGAFVYGELGARFPRAGGGYVYIRDAYGTLPAFLYGWSLLLMVATGAIAAVAVTFANYFIALTGLAVSPILLAGVAIVVLTAVNYVGVRPGAITQNIFTVLKLLALAVVIGAGIGAAAHWLPVAPAAAAPTHPPRSLVLGMAAALVPVLFSYGGWQQTNYIAEEIIDPVRNLPRALVIGVIGVVVVYLLANYTYVATLGAAGLAASEAPAADAMGVLLGPAGRTFITAGIVVSTFGFLNLVILVSPRVYQAMAADGIFFPQLATLHPRFRTPTPALVVQCVWAIILLGLGTYGALLDYVVFADWITFAATASTLFVYRARERRGEPGAGVTPFRTFGYPVAPLLFIAAGIYVVVGSVSSNPGNALKGTGLLLAGVPVYLFWKARTAGRQAGIRPDTSG